MMTTVSNWPIGSKCIYIYKGPLGWAFNPERHLAEVIGHTKARVQIIAFDGKQHYKATVKPESLVEREGDSK